MEIFEVRGERERYRDLLLFADPSWEMVMRYLPHGFMLAAREGDAVLGEIVTVPAAGGWEIKNLAVAEPFHRRGIGGALVRAAIARLPDGAGQDSASRSTRGWWFRSELYVRSHCHSSVCISPAEKAAEGACCRMHAPSPPSGKSRHAVKASTMKSSLRI